jgi:hypothetical protein
MKNFTPIVTTNAKLTRFQETPAYAEGLYDLGNRIYAWLVPNGSWGESNAGLIVGQRESLLIDTLWDVPKTLLMLDAMRQFTDAAPIKILVNTHADGDHFWGNESAQIIASASCAEEMRGVKPQKLILFDLLGKILSFFSLGNMAKAGRWFCGMRKPYDYAMDVNTILPGYGPIMNKNDVQQVKAYWEFLAEKIPPRFGRGLSTRQAVYDIVFHDDFDKQPFANWNSPERIITNTHITYRHMQGRTGPLQLPELLTIMWQQGLLAHDLPHAQPAVMRIKI